jgi:hypothetical protein
VKKEQGRATDTKLRAKISLTSLRAYGDSSQLPRC